MNVRQLQNLDPAGWTELLTQSPETNDVRVEEVTAEPFERGHLMTRYWLTLANHTDPITFIGKKTTPAEAYFYRHLAAELPELAPHPYMTDVLGAEGWILLREIAQDRPVDHWQEPEFDRLMAGLSALHATFWNQEAYLDQLEWLPNFRTTDRTLVSLRFEKRVSSYISDHAMQRAGLFAEPLVKTASALRRLIQLESWPDVYDERHLDALRFLLDDPLPALQPLLEMPFSLLHGQPSPHHWHLTMFDQCFLFDWQQIYIGPPVFELAGMLENIAWWQNEAAEPPGHRQQPQLEDTLIDTYLLQMGAELGSEFTSRRLRQTLASARCFHILTHGLPRYTAWLDAPPSPSLNWARLKEMDEADLFAGGYPTLAKLRRQLKTLFNRFLQEYMQM